MVLCPYRQAFVRRIQTRPFCDGPAQQDAIEFQPEVIVKTGGGVFLDQVREFVGACCYPSGRRFGRLLKIAFASIFFECHFNRPL